MTRVPIDTPDVVGKDLAPGTTRFQLHQPVESFGSSWLRTSSDPQDYIFNIKPVKLPQTPTPFEAMVVNIVVGTKRLVLASVDRFHDMSILDLLDELFELNECLCTVGGHPIIVGDFNCSGRSEDVVDHRLDNWLTCYRPNPDVIIERIRPRRLQNVVTVL